MCLSVSVCGRRTCVCVSVCGRCVCARTLTVSVDDGRGVTLALALLHGGEPQGLRALTGLLPRVGHTLHQPHLLAQATLRRALHTHTHTYTGVNTEKQYSYVLIRMHSHLDTHTHTPPPPPPSSLHSFLGKVMGGSCCSCVLAIGRAAVRGRV